MKRTALTFLALGLSLSVMAGDDGTVVNHDADEPGGFLTGMASQAIRKACSKKAGTQNDTMRVGRSISDRVSAPQFGAYYTGGYKYSNEHGKHGGPGFNTRLVRAYVDGTVLKHFAYRVQMELENTVHLKDAFIEYRQFKEARVKIGQFKRPFGFENPMNPWDVGMSDYSQFTKRLSGFSDYTYSEYNGCNGGRDLGLQVQGDLLPVEFGKERHAFVHYQAGVFNGQGINTTDANGSKDLIGTIQLQPVKGLFLGVFGWRGDIRANGVDALRRRWALGARFDRRDWSARLEYGRHSGSTVAYLVGMKQLYGSYSHRDRKQEHAKALYITVGAPITPWLKLYAKYDGFSTSDNFKEQRNDIWSLCPNFRLHKNLLFQIQWNFVHDANSKKHNELWCMAYVRI